MPFLCVVCDRTSGYPGQEGLQTRQQLLRRSSGIPESLRDLCAEEFPLQRSAGSTSPCASWACCAARACEPHSTKSQRCCGAVLLDDKLYWRLLKELRQCLPRIESSCLRILPLVGETTSSRSSICVLIAAPTVLRADCAFGIHVGLSTLLRVCLTRTHRSLPQSVR